MLPFKTKETGAMKEKLSAGNWFIIILFCFIGGIAWNTENMYFNTFICFS